MKKINKLEAVFRLQQENPNSPMFKNIEDTLDDIPFEDWADYLQTKLTDIMTFMQEISPHYGMAYLLLLNVIVIMELSSPGIEKSRKAIERDARLLFDLYFKNRGNA